MRTLTANRRSWSARARLWCLVTLVALAGCGNPAASNGTGSSPDNREPGQVALAYVRALFSGDFDRAQALVDPGSRAAFQLVALGMDPKLVTARDLGIGSTVVNGDRASTTILGTICRAGGATPGLADDCLTNNDPSTSNPIFKVALVRRSDGAWMVTLDLTGGVPPADLTRTPAASQSSVAPSHA